MPREFNEDAYQDRQLHKHLQGDEDAELVSECCGSSVYEDLDDITICFKCQDACRTITQGEYALEKYDSEMEDRADAERECKAEAKYS